MPADTPSSGDLLRIGEWIVDPALDTIARGAETHKVEPRTMRLLLCLAAANGGVVSVDRLLTEVWTGVIVGSASVYQAISQLRKILGDEDSTPTYIATVPRKGYRLVAAVSRIAPEVSVSQVTESVDLQITTAATPRRRRVIAVRIVAMLALLLAGGVLWYRLQPGAASSADVASIVVLPFIDLTAEKSDQIFCDGLTEELSNWLSQIPTLRVVARTSAFAFRGHDADVRKIGAALNTNHILEGSMRRSGDRVRITAQLIDARNGYHLWSEDFDRPMVDTIKVQEDISRAVAGVLQVRLTSDAERQFAARRTGDPSAYRTYLLAHHYARQLTHDSVDHAIDLYRQVLNADPNFAPAYASLAHELLNQGYFRDLPIQEVAAQMDPLIATALRLDPHLSAAYAVRGALRAAQSRTQEGLDDLKRAVDLNPNDANAWAEMGRIGLGDEGLPRKALDGYGRAAALDPLNSYWQSQRCVAYADLARYQDAQRACTTARMLEPDSTLADSAETTLAAAQGLLDQALKWNAAQLALEPRDDFNAYWTRIHLFLSVGLAAPAREVVEAARGATRDEGGANAALVRVVFCQRGVEALRRHLELSRLDDSSNSVELFEAAYAHLVIGDPAGTKRLIARALQAADRPTGYADSPWHLRGARAAGTSYRVDLAAAEIALGDRASADRELNSVLAMVNAMIGAGVERNATYELRARIHALKGEADEAIRDLDHAARSGWRGAWWALNEPYFATLRSRTDFRSLIDRINQSNQEMIKKIQIGNRIT